MSTTTLRHGQRPEPVADQVVPVEGPSVDVDLDEAAAPTDPVRAYLDAIGRVPLLTAAQEVDLSKRIEAGVYADQKLHWAREKTGAAGSADSRLSGQEREELATIAADGARAKEHMLRANLRLVVSIARRFGGRDLPFLDIVQEGNLGLIRAVEKFDYAKGYKFSTYATWWIRQSIQRGLAEQGRVVRLPVHLVEDLNRVLRVERELVTELGRDPTSEEVAKRADLSPARVVELRRVSRRPVSLDSPLGEEEKTRIIDLVEDAEADTPAEVVERQLLTAELERMLASLPPREAAIIALRFGLADGEPHTLDEVARRMGLTRERIRQLEKQTLAQLRDPSRAGYLLPWAS